MSTLAEAEALVEFRCQKCWHSNAAPISSCGQPVACATCNADTVVPDATPERLARGEQLRHQVLAAPVHKAVGDRTAEVSNPYAAPSSKEFQRMLQEDLQIDGFDFSNAPLASLVSRLLAVIADGMLDCMSIVVGLMLIFGAQYCGVISLESLEADGSLGLELYAIGGFPWLVLKIIQWNLIATRGQSLGKMLFYVRIVSMNGSAPGFVCGVILRNWLRSALGTIPFFGLIDIAFIFTESKRCLHDYLAGTRVVQA